MGVALNDKICKKYIINKSRSNSHLITFVK